MTVSYPAIYRDARGEEHTMIVNDGRTLTMMVRGVEFAGTDFDGFEPTAGWTDPSLDQFERFPYRDGYMDLCNCSIEWDMPVLVISGEHLLDGILHARLDLGVPNESGGLSQETLFLTLSIDGQEYKSDGKSGWFDDELISLAKVLPNDIAIKACHNCQFSDYPVAGYGLFGNMLCFRGMKDAYLATRGKSQFMKIMFQYTEAVQETHLCYQFELRRVPAGYRG